MFMFTRVGRMDFHFLRSDNEAKRGAEFRHSTRNVLKDGKRRIECIHYYHS